MGTQHIHATLAPFYDFVRGHGWAWHGTEVTDDRPGSLLHAMKSRHSPTRRTLRKWANRFPSAALDRVLNVFTTLSFVLPSVSTATQW